MTKTQSRKASASPRLSAKLPSTLSVNSRQLLLAYMDRVEFGVRRWRGSSTSSQPMSRVQARAPTAERTQLGLPYTA